MYIGISRTMCEAFYHQIDNFLWKRAATFRRLSIHDKAAVKTADTRIKATEYRI